MIIIKTKNGDHFINDKEIIEVAHDREKATVSCYGANDHTSHIGNVEGVIYTNDAQPTSWQDEGSMVRALTYELKKRVLDIGWLQELVGRYRDFLRDFASEMIQIVNYNNGQIEAETANRIRNIAEEMKTKANKNWFALRQEYDDHHKDDKDNEANIIQEQSERIASLSATIAELETRIETYKHVTIWKLWKTSNN